MADAIGFIDDDMGGDPMGVAEAINRLVSNLQAANATAAALATTVSGLSASLTTLSGTVTALSGTVTALSGTVTALAATVAAIPPGMVKLDEKVGTGLSGVLTFNPISGGYRSLELHIFGRSTVAATFAVVQLQFNADATAANYFHETIGAAATTLTASENIGTAGSIFVGAVTGATSPAGAYGVSTVQIPEYAHTGVHKGVTADVVAPFDYTSGNVQKFQDGGAWKGTAAISSLTLTLSSGSWTTDSRATLWGRP